MRLQVNGEGRDLPETVATVGGLIQHLGLAGRLAVELNGEIVPASRHATAPLQDGDRLEIVRAIGGG
jgi:thiamine biosynthesis protein ThiS